ncbi:MAG: hypothetical protein QM757_25300 [Paludibaculum sp.]
MAAMIATLPISLGPVLVFLALDHGPDFIAGSALGTMNANATHASFVLSYVLLAQRHGVVASLGGAFAIWVGVAAASAQPGTAGAAADGAHRARTSFVVHLLVRPYLKVRAKPPAGISRYAIPIRAACVAALVGIVTGLSERVGPQWSGILAGPADHPVQPDHHPAYAGRRAGCGCGHRQQRARAARRRARARGGASCRRALGFMGGAGARPRHRGCCGT